MGYFLDIDIILSEGDKFAVLYIAGRDAKPALGGIELTQSARQPVQRG